MRVFYGDPASGEAAVARTIGISGLGIMGSAMGANLARALGCPTPLFQASAPFYTAALAAGRGREDTAAVCAVLEALAGLERKPARRKAAR